MDMYQAEPADMMLNGVNLFIRD